MNPTITPEQQAQINASIAKVNELSKSVGAQYGTNLQQLTPLVSSSASEVQDEKDLGTTISRQTESITQQQTEPDNTALQSTFDQSQLLLQNYMHQLEERRKQEIEGINKGFDIRGEEQADAQVREKGATSVGLARMGGFLGGSASGTGVLLTLAKSHRQEVVALEAMRQDAIHKAQTAYADKQFALARSMVDDAQKFEEQIYQRNQDFWQRQLQAQQENRAQDKFLQEKFATQLEALATVGGTLDANTAAEIDAFYGVEGFAQKYMEAESYKNETQRIKARFELLEMIPAGVSVRMGNETVVGIGKTSDLYTVKSTNRDTGDEYIVTKDLRTGSITKTWIGNTGTGGDDSGGGTENERANEVIAKYQNIFNVSVASLDGKPIKNGDYLTPEAWRAAINDAPDSGLTRRQFITAFGYLVDSEILDEYKLTPEEQNIIEKF